MKVRGSIMAAVTAVAWLLPGPGRGQDLTAAWTNRLEWWREARFGMFVHWGPVSLTGHEIGWSRGRETPIEEYDRLYRRFNPTNFNAGAWAETARRAGMKYLVLTTKHHDGFCLWDTKQTDYNIMNSPFGRDVVKELSEACRRHGIAFGTYYSVCDWHHPAHPRGSPGGKTQKPSPDLEAYTRYLENQVAELITNCGPLLILWYDVPQEFDRARGERIIRHTRALQPDILINNRTGAPGDYDTPEQRVGSFRMDRPWETCMTIGRQWAWKPADAVKSLKDCLHPLVFSAGGDGNFLFNVGPTPDGRIEPEQAARLAEMGDWLGKYGESIYGTRGGPYLPTKHLASTRRGSTVYLHVVRWPDGPLALPPMPKRIVSSRLLTGGRVEVAATEQGLNVSVPEADRQEIDTIVALELDGPAMDIAPIHAASGFKARASNVFGNMPQYAAEMAVDGDPETRWATDVGTRKAWLEIDLVKPATFERIVVREAIDERVRKFAVQVKDGETWKTLFEGTTLGEKFQKKIPATTARELRLDILEATEGPTIWEFGVE